MLPPPSCAEGHASREAPGPDHRPGDRRWTWSPGPPVPQPTRSRSPPAPPARPGRRCWARRCPPPARGPRSQLPGAAPPAAGPCAGSLLGPAQPPASPARLRPRRVLNSSLCRRCRRPACPPERSDRSSPARHASASQPCSARAASLRRGPSARTPPPPPPTHSAAGPAGGGPQATWGCGRRRPGSRERARPSAERGAARPGVTDACGGAGAAGAGRRLGERAGPGQMEERAQL